LDRILVIRFSSIGDIVLCSPIVRAIKKQLDCEIYFLTKKQFSPLVKHNPYITSVIEFDENLSEVVEQINSLNIDLIIDLHNNLRSNRLTASLKIPSYAYSKRSFDRWLLTNLKWDRLSGEHIVERYFKAVKNIGVSPDNMGLEVHLPQNFQTEYDLPEAYHVYVIGTAHATKNIPSDLYIQLAKAHETPIVLLGGREHEEQAQQIANALKHSINLTGKTSLLEACHIINKADFIIGPDTGLSHIAAAFQKKQLMVFGSTHSKLGFTPYKNPNARIFEHQSLGCRPCTKQGKSSCPNGHFKCMLDLNPQELIETYTELIEN